MSGISELLEAQQLGKDQQGVLESVKEYYGEVRLMGKADTIGAFHTTLFFAASQPHST